MVKKSKKRKRNKCTSETYCDAIRELYSPSHDTIGLHILKYLHVPTFKKTLEVLVYRAVRGRKTPPMTLNFCPMCGFDMSKRKDWRG